MSGRRRQREALAEYSAAEQRQAQLEGSHALMRQLTGFKLSTQARLGRIGEARASLAALDADLAGSGESVTPARSSAWPKATRLMLSTWSTRSWTGKLRPPAT